MNDLRMPTLSIIKPTPFLRGPEEALVQRLDVTLTNPGEAAEMVLRLAAGGKAARNSAGPGSGGGVTAMRCTSPSLRSRLKPNFHCA